MPKGLKKQQPWLREDVFFVLGCRWKIRTFHQATHVLASQAPFFAIPLEFRSRYMCIYMHIYIY